LNSNATALSSADVRFAGVEKKFGAATALHRLDLSVPHGSFFSLLGPSGCGKTTTLRLVAGFEQPTSGDIYIRNKRVTGVPAYKRNFGMVFQNFALFPHLTVRENVAFGLQMRRVGREEVRRKVESALELVALGAFGDRYPRQLSGGQQQRVALARAVVFEPDVLLLDEPLSALDKMLREQMQVEIRSLQKRLGTTTIFVTHDQEEALTMSDRVAVMKDGRIQQIGAPREIYDRPSSEFVATFLGASNILDAVVEARSGDKALVNFGGTRFAVAGSPVAPGTRIKLALRPEKIAVRADGAVRARLREMIYRGAHTHLQLEVGGKLIAAVVPNSDVRPLALSPGEDIGLDWDADSLVALDGAP
jgi:spermidine/putrescine ABC transporter ATP-binding subunit